MKINIGSSTLELVQGDITSETTEAIVNAANSSLLGGGGVDGAIHRAGGPTILEECKKLGGCPAGEAKITTGGNLAAKYVIHTVGPIFRGGDSGEAEILRSTYRNSLRTASENGIRSLSFPSISTGAYGYPLEEASRVALAEVMTYLEEHPDIDLVRFVLFGKHAYEAYEKALMSLSKEKSRKV